MVKLYSNGLEFIEENMELLNEDIFFKSFFIMNSKLIDVTTANKYAFKVTKDSEYILVLADGIHNVLFHGNESLAKEVAQVIYGYNLEIKSLLGKYELVNEIAKELVNLYSGAYNITLDMDVMSCDTLYPENDLVEKAKREDIETITEYFIKFGKECLNEDVCYDWALNKITNDIDLFYVIKKDGKVVSMAKKTRELDEICSVSCVYTEPNYRGFGYCKKVVGYITNGIIKSNKLASLNVDRSNPISNRAYKAIGYKINYRQVEIKLNLKYKKMVIAGGCFWCMSKPFYEFDGVKAVYSGYTDGYDFNPTYEKVKKELTGHKEAVLIIYDPEVISYKELLTTYFENIDPFDDGGQFIDRGSNYESAVFTSNEEEINIYNEIVKKIEEQYNKKVLVPVIETKPFFMAEDYHQDFHLKNPEKFDNEEEISGRNAFEFIRIR